MSQRSFDGTLTPKIIFPSRRDNPIKAQGAGKASFTSLVVALGCGATSICVLYFNPSPNGTVLIPGVSFVQFQSMTPAKLAKLILKRHSLVMRLLVLNVFLHVPHQRRADRKRSVAWLPGKVIASLEPPRCGYWCLSFRTQGGVTARCARVSLPWASIGTSLRD